MPRLTYADIWETEQPWPDGPDVLGTIVRYSRGRAPVGVFTATADGRGVQAQFGIVMPLFVHPLLGLRSTVNVVPAHLWPVLQARATLCLRRYHDFDVEAVVAWASAQPYTDAIKLAFDARLASVENDRVLRGDDAFWYYVAEAFGLDPAALPPRATARNARFWSAQLSAD